MPEVIWTQGHMAWPLFWALAFTAVLALVVDFGWRVARMRSAYLLLASTALWLVGIIAIFSIGGR